MDAQRYALRTRTIVEALQWTGSNANDCFRFAGHKWRLALPDVEVECASGWTKVPDNWFIIKTRGQFYLTPPDSFLEAYERVIG